MTVNTKDGAETIQVYENSDKMTMLEENEIGLHVNAFQQDSMHFERLLSGARATKTGRARQPGRSSPTVATASSCTRASRTTRPQTHLQQVQGHDLPTRRFPP